VKPTDQFYLQPLPFVSHWKQAMVLEHPTWQEQVSANGQADFFSNANIEGNFTHHRFSRISDGEYAPPQAE
jgi:hypothetical protein